MVAKAEKGPLALPVELQTKGGAACSNQIACDLGVRELHLDTDVLVGHGRWAQIYAGRIVAREDSKTNSSTRIVLKLVDPKHFGDAMGDLDKTPEAYASDLVDREASAYAALAGCPFVPTWFGTYQILLPDARRVYGHVLEYIEGERFSIDYLPPNCREEDEMTPWILCAAEALDSLHKRGVYHRDVRQSNVIVPSRKDRSIVPLVFIDFGSALVGDSSDPTDRTSRNGEARRKDFSQLAILFNDYVGFDYEDWRDWLRRSPKTPLIRAFMSAWNVLDTLEAERDRHIASLRTFKSWSEAEVLRNAAALYPTLPPPGEASSICTT